MTSKWRNRPDGKTVRRNKPKSKPFVMLPWWMIDSPAWRSLSGEEIAAFVELSRVYNGFNNGSLAMPTRRLARIRNRSKDTAARSIRGLLDKGFIEIVRASGFNVKTRLAAEYRLTMFHCDVTRQPPSKAFMKWRPNISYSESRDTTVRPVGRDGKRVQPQPDVSDCWARNQANRSPASRPHIDICHTGSAPADHDDNDREHRDIEPENEAA
jgi:hypothetical protein